MLLKKGEIVPVSAEVMHPTQGWMSAGSFALVNAVVSGNGYSVRVDPDDDGYVALIPGDWVVPGDEIRDLGGGWSRAEAIGSEVAVAGYYRRRYVDEDACIVCQRTLIDGICEDCRGGVESAVARAEGVGGGELTLLTDDMYEP